MLEWHHIFNGSNKKKSEQFGAMVRLCHYCHNEPPIGVHFNKEFNLALKAEAEKLILDGGMSKEEFIKLFGKNYI